MSEEWKDIVGYENIYQISNFGRVKSLARKVRTGRAIPERMLKPYILKTGYLQVDLYLNGHRLKITLPRLLALAFIPNPNNYPMVNHKDGNKQNNILVNLEWITGKENMIHAVDTGLIKTGKQSPSFKSSIAMIDSSGNLVKVFTGRREITEYGLEYRNVYACIHGRRKTHKGFTFKRLPNG